MLIKSPLRILPSLPEPLTFFKSILFSTAIFLTAGEGTSLFLFEDSGLSSLFSLFNINGASSLTSLVNIKGSSSSGSLKTLGTSFFNF